MIELGSSRNGVKMGSDYGISRPVGLKASSRFRSHFEISKEFCKRTW